MLQLCWKIFFTDIIDRFINRNLLISDNIATSKQSHDDDYQTSVSVDDETGEKIKLKHHLFYSILLFRSCCKARTFNCGSNPKS